MKYIDYNNMKDFFTIQETCRLFDMDKQELKYYAEQYNIEPQEDQYGNWGFRKQLVRKLHNFIYKEQKRNQADEPYQPQGKRGKGNPWD